MAGIVVTPVIVMAIRFVKAAATAKRDGGPRLTEKEVREIAAEGVTTAEPVALDGGRGQTGVDRPVLGGRDPEPCPDDATRKRGRGRPPNPGPKPWEKVGRSKSAYFRWLKREMVD